MPTSETVVKYAIQIRLVEFIPVELERGDYHLRCQVNSPSKGGSVIRTDLAAMEECLRQGSSIAEGRIALSKLIEVRECWAPHTLHHTCDCELELPQKLHKDDPTEVTIHLELWHGDTECDECCLAAKRTISIRLPLHDAVHSQHLPVFFEPPASSALSVIFHSSLVGINISKVKAPPSSRRVTDKIRSWHSYAIRPMLSAMQSLHQLLHSHKQCITSPLQIDEIDPSREELALRKELEVSNDAWTQLVHQADELSERLIGLYRQVTHLFFESPGIAEEMVLEAHRRRLDRLAEGFLCREESIESLLQASSLPNQGLSLLDSMKKDHHLERRRPAPITLDGENGDSSLIVERKFVPLRSRMRKEMITATQTRKVPSEPSGKSNGGAVLRERHNSQSWDPWNRRRGSWMRHTLFWRKSSHEGHLYSDLLTQRTGGSASEFVWFSHASHAALEEKRRHPTCRNTHLIVFVHGLQGSFQDLAGWKAAMQMVMPEASLCFLLSDANPMETWCNLETMAENLLDEVLSFVRATTPSKISFVAHSLGGLIVRKMCELEGASPTLTDKLHTLLTLNTPHCGLRSSQKVSSWGRRNRPTSQQALRQGWIGTRNLGMSLLQWFKQSPCLDQLLLRDADNIRESFIYRLSENGSFGLFKNVLLVGAVGDLYVPHHSALIELPPSKSPVDETLSYYTEMLNNINEALVASRKPTTLIKYTVMHATSNASRLHQLSGRAVHVAALDDDGFIEKLLSSAERYFR